jgi:thiol-disulfide isomerase/thioredoxin
VFLSNHCPDSHAAQGRILKLVAEMKDKGLVVVAINPNNPDGVSLDELGYSKYSDSFEDMKKYAADTKLTIPYLYDGEKQTVARAYGCLATPHVFIFDAQRKLRYKGQFDDSRFAEESTVHSTDARDAVVALLAHQPVPVAVTRPHGCSTKWLENRASIAATVAKWDKTPVDVALIDAAGVAALRKNGTKKVRLFNVWATTCPPCRTEFPELVKTSRQFSLRDFELITISLDDPKDTDKAKAFLEKQGAGVPSRLKPALKAEGRATNSYLYTGTNKDLIAALDPDWPGPAPHTVLVGPKGDIIWRHNGPVNGDELRAKVLGYMGEYYAPSALSQDQDKSTAEKPKKPALYDPKADTRAQIDAATAKAKRQNARVLVMFGFEG